MPADTNVLIIAGEPSGDMHASNLVRDLKTLRPGLKFFGMGAGLSAGEGVEIVCDISSLALVGVVEVVKNIYSVGKAFRTVLKAVDKRRPALAILVDYPGFNLRLAGELKRRNIPVVYYVSPQLWAWGADRIKIIKRCVKRMVVFFGFEEDLYKKNGVDVAFVGNPLVDSTRITSTRKETLEKYGLRADRHTIALVPGSRKLEVEGFLGALARSAELLKRTDPDAQFIVTRHPGLPEDIYKRAIGARGDGIKIVAGDMHNILAASDLAVVASGTATLETAVIGTPMIVVYKANLLTYLIYKFVRPRGFLGLPNIIAGRRIVPELLQRDMTPGNISAEARRILSEGPVAAGMRKELALVKSSLGAPGASMRAAKSILPLLP